MANESNLAFRAEVAAAIDYMTDVATSQHAWDDPIGKHYHLIVIAARAYLENAPVVIPLGFPNGLRESGNAVRPPPKQDFSNPAVIATWSARGFTFDVLCVLATGVALIVFVAFLALSGS